MKKNLKILSKKTSSKTFFVSLENKEEPSFNRQNDHRERILATDMEKENIMAISILVPTISSKDLAWWDKVIAKKEFIKKNSNMITLKRNGHLSLSVNGLIVTIYSNNKIHLSKIIAIGSDYISVKYHFVDKKRYSFTMHLENIKEVIIDA